MAKVVRIKSDEGKISLYLDRTPMEWQGFTVKRGMFYGRDDEGYFVTRGEIDDDGAMIFWRDSDRNYARPQAKYQCFSEFFFEKQKSGSNWAKKKGRIYKQKGVIDICEPSVRYSHSYTVTEKITFDRTGRRAFRSVEDNVHLFTGSWTREWDEVHEVGGNTFAAIKENIKRHWGISGPKQMTKKEYTSEYHDEALALYNTLMSKHRTGKQGAY